MIRIACLFPEENMVHPAWMVAEEMNFAAKGYQLTIDYGPSYYAHEWAQRITQEEADIVIARGLQALYIKQDTTIPLVEIHLTGQEMGLLVNKAKAILQKPRPQIAVIGYKNQYCNMDSFSEIFDIDLRTYFARPTGSGPQELTRCAREAIVDGADLIISGDMGRAVAKEHNIPSLYIDSTGDSFRQALSDANRLAYAIELEKSNTARMKTLLDNTFGIIVHLNEDGCVSLINRGAEKLLGWRSDQVVGHSLTELVPSLKEEKITAVLKENKEFFSEYMEIGSVEVIANLSPIQIDGHTAGAIFSAQEFSRLETMGNKARQMQFVGQPEDNVRLKDIEEPSRAMRAAVENAAVYAKSQAPVLITAAPGTDARRLARAIHNETKTTNYVMIDCAALEKENQVQLLFGSGEKDSGLISSARGGTLYLANIEKLSSPCQQRLLRMVQENVLLSADGRSTYANIRVIASCKESLPQDAAEGKFSTMLYYMLNTLPLTLTALHTRPEDIAYWTDFLLKRYRKEYKRYIQLTAGGMQQMTKFAWEGGLVQLAAFCQNLVLTVHHRSMDENALRKLYVSMYPPALPASHAPVGKEKLKENNHESDAILSSLQRHQGNRGETAAELGISTTTLWRKMKKYGIQNIFEEN